MDSFHFFFFLILSAVSLGRDLETVISPFASLYALCF